MGFSRREFEGLVLGAGVAVSWPGSRAGLAVRLRRYVDTVPRLPVARPRRSVYAGVDYYELTLRQRHWRFHRDLPAAETWGYWAVSDHGRAVGPGYLGPTLVARSDRPVVVRYRNRLPEQHLLRSAVDVTLWKNLPGIPPDPPGGRMPQDFPARTTSWSVTHLHGGRNFSASDGLPEAWFTPDGRHGPDYRTLPGAAQDEALYAYGNQQRATALWYHDHAMAINRLNMYAGLAGLYLIRDAAEDGLALPRGDFEVPLIIQDRDLTADGALSYPDKGPSPYHPRWNPNFFARIPVVNGKAYPYLAVEPRRYRLRLLNASNQRFFHLWLQDGAARRPFWLIGTDGGLRAAPLRLTAVWLPPAARLDLIVDLTGIPRGRRITMMNDAATPFPGNEKPTPMPEIMQFHLTRGLSGPDRTTPPDRLRFDPIPALRPTPGLPARQFVLIANKDAAGKSTHLAIDQRFFNDPMEEFPKASTTEVWEYINVSGDGHPMHVHLVQFQILNRQRINAKAYQIAYKKWVAAGRPAGDRPILDRYLIGDVVEPAPEELGWKDIVIAHPGMVSRIALRFDLPTPLTAVPGTSVYPATYIQHCHMLEHEDNEMMRPWQVMP